MSVNLRTKIAIASLLSLTATVQACRKDAVIQYISRITQGSLTGPVTVSSEWLPPVSLGPPINTSAWEDSPCISPDGSLLFFSRGRHDRGQQDRDVGVYYSRKADGKWTQPVYCDFNMKSYPTSAVKAQDDQTVYFASVRPGGYGQGDIYLATSKPGGGWSPGQNIGPPVNTKFNESEPYVSRDGTKLYFTSERPGGLGGMDNWVSTRIDGKWTNPVNLGRPVNSSYDDLQPFLTQDGLSLYFVRMNFADVGRLVEGYHAAIRKCDRVNGGWSNPHVVVSDLVGEPSLTSDGRYLYFSHIIFSGGRPVDSEIMMAEKK